MPARGGSRDGVRGQCCAQLRRLDANALPQRPLTLVLPGRFLSPHAVGNPNRRNLLWQFRGFRYSESCVG